MDRLVITDYIQKVANKYAIEVRKVGAIDNLKKLKEGIENGSYVIIYSLVGRDHKRHRVNVDKKNLIDYIGKIIECYNELLTIHPCDFLDKVSTFNDILSQELLKVKIKCPILTESGKKNVRKPFYSIIVDNMGYKDVQKNIFPKLMKYDLNIKTCVYCNSQYAIAADDKTALYELDHCFPKSKFPYLCTSFFNLQPCCGSCNRRKNDKDKIVEDGDLLKLSIWKEKDDDSTEPFIFRLDQTKLSTYLLRDSSHDASLLEIKYECKEGASLDSTNLLRKIDKMFHITDLYKQHIDIVEETIWRHKIYSDSYVNGLLSQFGKYFPNIKDQARRLIKGTYEGNGIIYKRPLTKMMHDIDDQLNQHPLKDKIKN